MFSPDRIQNVPQPRAPMIIVYAPNGHGKTTFVISSKKAFVIDTEDKYNDTSVSRFVPANLSDIKDCLAWLETQEVLQYNLIAIDTLDWVEKSIGESVTFQHGASHANDGTKKALEFQGGNAIISNIFNVDVLARLMRIRAKHNIPIVLCGQARDAQIDSPDATIGRHKTIDLRLTKRLSDFVSDQVEAKLYIQIEHISDHKGLPLYKDAKDQRFLITQMQKGIAAKNSLNLPRRIPISEDNGWNDFVAAIPLKTITN